MRASVALCAALAFAGAAKPSRADQIVLRSGNHIGFGRLVLDIPPEAKWHQQRGDRGVTIAFEEGTSFTSLPFVPHNVNKVEVAHESVRISVYAGVKYRLQGFDDRIVFDALDPHPEEDSTAVKPAELSQSKPILSPSPDRHDQLPLATEPASSTNLAIRPAKTPEGDVIFPFDESVGAALVPIHNKFFLLFDVERPIDLSALKADPLFGAATVKMVPGATVVQAPVGAGGIPNIDRSRAGWRVTTDTRHLPAKEVEVRFAPTEVRFVLDAPGRSIGVADPDTGDILLVATSKTAHEAVSLPVTGPTFRILQTPLGIAVEPLSDDLLVTAAANGFLLTSRRPSAELGMSDPRPASGVGMLGLTTSFRLPNTQDIWPLERLRYQTAEAGRAPPLARPAFYEAAARQMISLGLGYEAQSLLKLEEDQDPKTSNLPEHLGLSAVAALVAGRPEEARSIVSAAGPESDEFVLWRAIRDAELDNGPPTAGAMFAAVWPVILSYGPALRHRLLPLVADTLIAGNQLASAEALLNAAPDEAALDFDRGMLAEAQGHRDRALTMYDKIATGRDRLTRIRAAVRAVDLRLAMHILNDAQAADALDSLRAAWHGGTIEFNLRLREADLRIRTAAWATALDELKSLAADFPEHGSELRERRMAILSTLIKAPDQGGVSPFQFVSMISDNADAFPVGEESELQALVADRLIALDLPRQAEAALEKLFSQAPSDGARAQYGLRISELRLSDGDASGALNALVSFDAKELPTELGEKVLLLRARATAEAGDLKAAQETLRQIDTPEAEKAQAELFERMNDWAGASQALRDYFEKTVPKAAPLTGPQRSLILRLATDLARANDEAGLLKLGEQERDRMGPGPSGDIFHFLTARPVRTLADIHQSPPERDLIRSLRSLQ